MTKFWFEYFHSSPFYMEDIVQIIKKKISLIQVEVETVYKQRKDFLLQFVLLIHFTWIV